MWADGKIKAGTEGIEEGKMGPMKAGWQVE